VQLHQCSGAPRGAAVVSVRHGGHLITTVPVEHPAPSSFKVITAFLIIYIVWGSTYLAIRFGVETLPPFLMAATRFLLAGSVLFLWDRYRGAPMPTLPQWRSGAIIGGMLLVVGNGGVTWAEREIPSGVTALLVSTSPIWFVILDWLAFDGPRPTRRVVLGLAIGLCGVLLLIGPDRILTGGGFSIAGIIVLMMATVSWAGGSLYSRRASLPASPLMATAVEMLAGGAILLVVSTVAGEPFHLDPSQVSVVSLLSLGYLFVFGSLIGFTAYVWLLRVSTPARVSTYAYVNPVIAVVLGWTMGGEELSGRMILAAGVIVAGVVLIVMRKK
jgi:drug/metabolite transporter (DMT)-like permease